MEDAIRINLFYDLFIQHYNNKHPGAQRFIEILQIQRFSCAIDSQNAFHVQPNTLIAAALSVVAHRSDKIKLRKMKRPNAKHF